MNFNLWFPGIIQKPTTSWKIQENNFPSACLPNTVKTLIWAIRDSWLKKPGLKIVLRVNQCWTSVFRQLAECRTRAQVATTSTWGKIYEARNFTHTHAGWRERFHRCKFFGERTSERPLGRVSALSSVSSGGVR